MVDVLKLTENFFLVLLHSVSVFYSMGIRSLVFEDQNPSRLVKFMYLQNCTRPNASQKLSECWKVLINPASDLLSEVQSCRDFYNLISCI